MEGPSQKPSSGSGKLETKPLIPLSGYVSCLAFPTKLSRFLF
jgi:hypothetical protein